MRAKMQRFRGLKKMLKFQKVQQALFAFAMETWSIFNETKKVLRFHAYADEKMLKN